LSETLVAAPPSPAGGTSAFVGSRWFFVIVLVVLGVGWGSTQSLGKIATATGHQPFGLIFWQLVVGRSCWARFRRSGARGWSSTGLRCGSMW
jgi:hypothetical protein